MMDVEYKAHIVELEAKEPAMPLEQREARIKELKASSTSIALLLEDVQKILSDATATWTGMEEIPDLVTVYEEV